MEIGSYTLGNNLFVAPMAGIADRPYRRLCRKWGAGYAVSEMVSANAKLRHTEKTQRRMDLTDEPTPRAVQIVGSEPTSMALAAQYQVDCGAQIIDINMGCPARKVCGKFAGSALLEDEDLVARILAAVTRAVSVPVTLKMRTGSSPARRNGVRIARIAEASGILALAVHGRTRACKFRGPADYDTIREIKRTVAIPVVANGDIDSPQKAKQVLEYTGADGVMIGRAAQGRPWLFMQTAHYLRTGQHLSAPPFWQQLDVVTDHVRQMHEFYGVYTGVRMARKHIGWYTASLPGQKRFRARVNRVEDGITQIELTKNFFEQLIDQKRLAA